MAVYAVVKFHVMTHIVLQCFACFVALNPNQTLWSLWDGQSPNFSFFLGKLEQAVNQYFVHILLLVTDSNSS